MTTRSAPGSYLRRQRIRAALAALALIGLFVLAALHWREGIPGVAELRGYLFRPHHRHLHVESWAWIALAVVVCAYAIARLAARRFFALAVAIVTLGALAAQLYTAALDGPGLHTLFYRFEYGHRPFMVAARQRRAELDDTLRNYEELATGGALGEYAPSKPPGIHLVFAGVDALGQQPWFQAITGDLRAQAERHPRIGAERDAAVAAAVLFPFSTALAVVPFAVVAFLLLRDRRRAIDASMLFACTPNYVIFSGHTDGAVFPLLACLVALGIVLGIAKDRPIIRGGNPPQTPRFIATPRSALLRSMLAIALGGAAWAFGTWTTFSLLPALGFAGVCGLAVLARARRPAPVALRGIGFFCIGALAVVAVLAALDWLGSPALRFSRALAYHVDWKVGKVGGRWAVLGLAELGVYLGFPLVAAIVVSAITARRDAILRVGMPAMLGLLAWTGGCCEAARLWMFVSPFLILGIAPAIAKLEGRRHAGWIAALLVALNLGLVPIIRASQGW